MTRKKKISPSIAICLLVVALTGPMAIDGLSISSHLIRPNSLVSKNTDTSVRGFKSSQRDTIASPTATYSKSEEVKIDEFKDINIDDVLLEAENALKFAQTSIADDDGGEKGKTEGLEDALKFAQTSLVDSGAKKVETKSVKVKDELDFSEITEILASTLGGLLVGTVLGTVATFQLSDLELMRLGAGTFESNAIQLAIPVIVGTSLGGITGFVGSLQGSGTSAITRNILGVPGKALASAIVNSIQDAATRQVEKTANEIKSIPGNIANYAVQQAAQKADEDKLAVEMALKSLFEKLKTLVLALAVLSSLVALGVVFINNGGLNIAEITPQQL